MVYPSSFKEQRKEARVNTQSSVLISIGTQLSFQGQLRDLSMNSAFVVAKDSIFLEAGDAITLSFPMASANTEDPLKVFACVSRMVKGEGFAVYFTKMTDSVKEELQKLCRTKI